MTVSTHSRPKAAAFKRAVRLVKIKLFQHTAARRRLQNEQYSDGVRWLFQHTAARRRLLLKLIYFYKDRLVSTHSRPKAAAIGATSVWTENTGFNTQPPEGGCHLDKSKPPLSELVSTHSRPKAAAILSKANKSDEIVSTHSRPKAAALKLFESLQRYIVSTHSRPKAAADLPLPGIPT